MYYLWIFSVISSLSAPNRTAKNTSNKSYKCGTEIQAECSRNNPATSRPGQPTQQPTTTRQVTSVTLRVLLGFLGAFFLGRPLLLFSSQDSSSQPLALSVLSKISMKKNPEIDFASAPKNQYSLRMAMK
ncbi:hypothetical protein EDD85DRAFT_233260 [Armillaria nabsnona]|nr:hypothetical protein EDD85DRAFT_233260 [Armillaria nabsnona]